MLERLEKRKNPKVRGREVGLLEPGAEGVSLERVLFTSGGFNKPLGDLAEPQYRITVPILGTLCQNRPA
jgi:hypothetical protein